MTAPAVTAPGPAGPGPIPGGGFGPGLGGALTPAPGASLRLPGEHFAAALAFLLLGAAGLVWVAPELAGGAYLSPHVAGVTHLFTLGWLTLTIFGATYQLIPVALGAPVWSERLGHISFACTVPGIALFALGVMRNSITLHHTGIALLAIGIILLITNVAGSLPRAHRRDVTWAAMGIAVAFLALTLVLGVVLLHNVVTGALGTARQRILATHLHVALLGWVFVMIVGMSHRLLPMFLVAHGADTRWTRRALTCLVPGVLVLGTGLAGAIGPVAWVGALLVEAAMACYLIQARGFFRSRIRRHLDAGLRHAATALLAFGGAALLAPAVLALGPSHLRLDTLYIALGVLGAFSLYVVGLFYKIVPFLAWITRYRHQMGRGRVPTVAQLYSTRVAHLDLAFYVAGLLTLLAGIAIGQAWVVRAGAVGLLLAIALFVSQMIHATWGEPFPAATPPIPGGAR